MLAKTQMQEIQDLKLQGYTKTDIIHYYEAQGTKPPSRPTINKYYDMDVVPEDPGAKLAKERTFDAEPFRSTIIMILEANSGKKFCMSSVYDVLEEKFIENGDFEQLPGNEQTLRNYIHHLQDEGVINLDPEHRRSYDYVFDTPPGEQMLIDFGEEVLDNKKHIHFICLLLRYSRYLCVYAQDHRYNALEACQAIYHSFCRLGGRPKQLVIDQDAVFVSSETFGEVILSTTFDDFCSEQDLELWVCNKHDPESKGPIENAVGFVKKNFFSARKLTCIDDVWRSLPGWLDRKNRRIHQTTLHVPRDVFEEIEQKHLEPLLPSVYETSPNTFKTYKVGSMPYITYKSNKYSLPQEYAYQNVQFKAAGGKLYIYDDKRKLICTHNISECKGGTVKLPEHCKQEDADWVDVMERLRDKWDCCDFQHFINGFKKENGHYVGKQLLQVEQFLDSEKPDRSLVAEVMKECCENFRYKFSQFKKVYELADAGRKVSSADSRSQIPTGDVTHADLSIYDRAFRDRTVREGATV